MAWYSNLFGNRVDEQIAAFKNKDEDAAMSDAEAKRKTGEGIEDVLAMQMTGYGSTGLGGFNSFYNSFINKMFETEYQRILEYRKMAEYPEIADVIEDACNEMTDSDEEENVISLDITDEKLAKNENMTKTLYSEFEKLFYENIDINDKLWELLKTYFIDGRVFYERIIDTANRSKGILNIRKLPSETMDYEYEPKTGRILTYYQYLIPNMRRPVSRSMAERDKADGKLIIFEPAQIGFIHYGVFGQTMFNILGFLEKAKVPYNQLKLLETSVIIYRMVRSPERLVFKIDTGAMPRDKAMQFVEKIKQKFIKKQSYNPQTGALTNEPEVLSILENYFLPTSSDGRGSDISTVGGDSAGFTELSDIFYFSHKLFRALKYPISRITQGVEQGQEVVFGGTGAGQIGRDEIKWSKFLERQQRKFCNELVELFLLHLDFRGIKKQYNLDVNSFAIRMNPPSHYKEQMAQGFLEQSFQNYNGLNQNAEFSKSYLVKKYLHWTEKELQENREGFKLDKKYFPGDEVMDNVDTFGGGGMGPGMLSMQMGVGQEGMEDDGMGGGMMPQGGGGMMPQGGGGMMPPNESRRYTEFD